LLSSPKLLLLDEPLSSLDMRLRQQILPFLKLIKDEIKIPMIYVSHDMTEIKYLTDDILMIDAGRIVT
jgi:molybdate transport system ATP-binding protein